VGGALMAELTPVRVMYSFRRNLPEGQGMCCEDFAAWLCHCGYPQPLLGKAHRFLEVREEHNVWCPGCNSLYRVSRTGRGAAVKVLCVQEID
jgi:hypothetical protein